MGGLTSSIQIAIRMSAFCKNLACLALAGVLLQSWSSSVIVFQSLSVSAYFGMFKSQLNTAHCGRISPAPTVMKVK